MRKCKTRKLLWLSKANTSEAALPFEGYSRTRLKECQSAALNGWQWMHLCKEKQLWEKMGGCVSGCWRGGTMEWKVREILGEFCETLRRRRQCDDGWGGKWWIRKRAKDGERGRTRGEQLYCSWHLHRKHLGKLSIKQARLIDFLLFSISFSLCVPLFLQNAPWCKNYFIIIILHLLCFMLGPNGECHILSFDYEIVIKN